MIAKTKDDELNDWLTVVDREARRSAAVDRTLRSENSGPLTVPIRFGYKVLEIGPARASKLALSILTGRLRAR